MLTPIIFAANSDTFCDNPLYYQEDFMWMGFNAFVYYFPVLEKYVRECDFIDEASVIGRNIEFQITKNKNRISQELKERIIQLASFIVEAISNRSAVEYDNEDIVDQ